MEQELLFLQEVAVSFSRAIFDDLHTSSNQLHSAVATMFARAASNYQLQEALEGGAKQQPGNFA